MESMEIEPVANGQEKDLEKEVLSVVRKLPVKSQAEMLQLVNELRLVAECISPIDEAFPIIDQLRNLGFKVLMKSGYIPGCLSFVVSKSEDLAKEVIKDAGPDRKDDQRYGELMGFPATAIHAFSMGEEYMIPREEQDKLIGFVNPFCAFRLSKDSFREELDYIRKNYQLILEKAPYLITELIDKDDLDDYMEKVVKFIKGESINNPKVTKFNESAF